MLRSAGFRFFVVGLLTLLMYVPAIFVSSVINERADYNRQTTRSVGQEWGGSQVLSGPVLVLPVEEDVTTRIKEEVLDPVTGIQMTDEKGTPMYRFQDVTETVRRAPIYLLPNQFQTDINTMTEQRYRGFFSVPVYQADVDMRFDFALAEAEAVVSEGARILWSQARVQMRVTSNRALRGAAELTTSDQSFRLEPLAQDAQNNSGLQAVVGNPRDHSEYNLRLRLFGASKLSATPVGRTSTISIHSDWPHPSFFGAFLPEEKQITETGFTARWTIPHLARSVPQVAREDVSVSAAQTSSMGVEYYQPNDFYQQSFRAARYGLMFIALTFLAIFAIEGRKEQPTHPVQYVLVGISQLTFFLLMLALAEQIGFTLAYWSAAGATVGLISLFAAIALRLGLRSFALGGMLLVLYGVLYLILQSADFALLAGSMLAFGAVALTMFATRNENWYAAPGQPGGTGWFRRKPANAVPTSGAKDT